jgi:hypothetical protein
MQRLRVGASCRAFMVGIGAYGFVVAIAVANAAIPCSVAALLGAGIAPVLLGYKF